MPANDSAHTFKLTIGGTDYSTRMVKGSVNWTLGDRGRTAFCEFGLWDNGYSFAGWEEVILWADYGTGSQRRLFGGYLVRPNPERLDATTGRRWALRAEGYMVRCEKTVLDRKAYVGQTVKGILGDMVGTLAGLSDFDVTALVSTGGTLDRFDVDRNETLQKALDRLITMAGSDWTWGVTVAKQFYAGSQGTTAAPYAVSDRMGDVDWSTVFPMQRLTASRDGLGMFNRIRVDGGNAISEVQTETFAGSEGYSNADGDVIFNLAQTAIRQFVSVTLNGVEYYNGVLWGWDWFSEVGRHVYGDRSGGTLRWIAGAVEAGDVIVVKYTYDTNLSVTRTNAALYASLGFYLDGPPIVEPTITTEAAARALADAVLALPAVAGLAVAGGFEVDRLGLEPGQEVTITSDVQALSGGYLISQVAGQILEDGEHVRLAVKFGDETTKLTDLIANFVNTGQQPAYPQPQAPVQDPTVNRGSVAYQMSAGRGMFVPP